MNFATMHHSRQSKHCMSFLLHIAHHALRDTSHLAKIKINQNCRTGLQILDIWCKNVRQKCRESKKKKFHGGLFCKSRLSKMASTKTNKIEKRTPLPKTNFLRYTTLLLGPKRFVHSKGPKIALCLC